MNLKNPRLHYLILFIIIFVEGYVVLASEILAIRQITAYVGNGVNTVSIIIAAVLMPLAFGYYRAGKFKPHYNWRGKFITVRRQLISNVFISTFFLIPALATVFIDLFFVQLFQIGISDRIVLTSLYSALFLVVPVFLLGQTIPLISHYFPVESLSKSTGKILFVSTAGSFIGSIFTTIVMMQYFGVNQAANVIIGLMLVLALLLSKKALSARNIIMIVGVSLMLTINSNVSLKALGIIYDNSYNTFSIINTPTGKILSLNRSFSSFLGNNGEKFPYVEYIEQNYINPIADGTQAPKKILIIGAAGFTMGSNDNHNEYIYIDIDPDIKETAEKHFLGHPLGKNKTFIGHDAISYLSGQTEKFDLIILDAYSSAVYIPEQLLTQNFFSIIKKAMNKDGIVLANFIMSPNFADPFSKRLDNTFRSVFPNYGRQLIGEQTSGWSNDPYFSLNAIYSYRDVTEEDRGIYTNNKNTSSYDKMGVQYKMEKEK